MVSVAEHVLPHGKHRVAHSTIKQFPYGSLDKGIYGDKYFDLPRGW
jgi:hypothetical protein